MWKDREIPGIFPTKTGSKRPGRTVSPLSTGSSLRASPLNSKFITQNSELAPLLRGYPLPPKGVFLRPKASFRRNHIAKMRLFQSFQPFQGPQNCPLSSVESNGTEISFSLCARFSVCSVSFCSSLSGTRNTHYAPCLDCQRTSRATSSVISPARLRSSLPPRQADTIAHRHCLSNSRFLKTAKIFHYLEQIASAQRHNLITFFASSRRRSR